jgi:O-antigen/teichoic acid export membrane protein
VSDKTKSPAQVDDVTTRRKLLLAPAALRIAGVGAALATNYLIARHLTLENIAFYYLYSTLAYFGNACFYVGLGIVLQRLCASLASRGELNLAFLIRYLASTLCSGTIIVTLFAVGYLLLRGGADSPWWIAFWCALLSAANYLSSVGRDLLALNGRLGLSSFFWLFEQCLRVCFVSLALLHFNSGAIEVTASVALGSLISGCAGLAALIAVANKSTVPPPDYTLREIASTAAPVACSGLLNWVQLQSYRPALLYFRVRPETIGVTSLLTSLGITGANPILSVISQSFVPRYYAGERGVLARNAAAIARAVVVLSIGSIPAAIMFLVVSNRQPLLMYALLVPLGVLVEAGNSLIVANLHRQNSERRALWVFPASACIGVIVAAASWNTSLVRDLWLPYQIALGMVASQAAVLGFIYFVNADRRKHET